MSIEIITSFLTVTATCITALGGILISNKLTIYRIAQLEEKVNKHNNVIERVFKLEQKVEDLEDK